MGRSHGASWPEQAWGPLKGLKRGRICSYYGLYLILKDEEEPRDEDFSPDGGYIPRILFLGKATELAG